MVPVVDSPLVSSVRVYSPAGRSATASPNSSVTRVATTSPVTASVKTNRFPTAGTQPSPGSLAAIVRGGLISTSISVRGSPSVGKTQATI